jgi:hypothetical protein
VGLFFALRGIAMTRAERLQHKIKYQLRAVRNTIISKEKHGEDANFERKLLKSWAKYEGWEDAVKYLP